MSTEAVATREVTAVPVGDAQLPSPVFRGAHMARALADYRELQKALDEAMPDQVMMLQGRPFRKKGYWRAIEVAFGLTVEPIPDSEERTVVGVLDSGAENYLYTVTYRATAPNGRSAAGDGACAAAEKQRGRMEATEHNVRSHCHTRAFNRSVSNLVGFGEVSAEEVEREEHSETPVAAPTRADGATLVVKVEEKTGTNKKTGKGWIRFVVTFEDGRVASTFDREAGAMARKLGETKMPMVPVLVKSGDYLNLEGFTAPEADGASAPAGNGDTGELIDEGQHTKFWGVAKAHGWPPAEVQTLLAEHGYSSSKLIRVSGYEAIVQQLKERQKGNGGGGQS